MMSLNQIAPFLQQATAVAAALDELAAQLLLRLQLLLASTSL